MAPTDCFRACSNSTEKSFVASIGLVMSNDMKSVYPYHEVDRRRARPTVLGFLTVATLLGTFVVDLGLPDGVAAWAPYCLSIVLALQWKGTFAVATVSGIAMVFTAFGQWIGPLGDFRTDVTNRAIGVVTITSVGLACLYIDRRRQRLLRSRTVIASSHDRLRSFVNSLNSAGVVLCDLRGRVTEWSQGAQLLTGHSMEDIVGQPLYRVFPGKANPVTRWSQICHTVRKEGKAVREEAYQHRDGSWCWLHIVVKPLRDRFRRLQGYSLVIHDLTKATASTTRSEMKTRPISPILTNGFDVVRYRCRFEPCRTLEYLDTQIDQLMGDSGNECPALHTRALGEWIHPLDQERVWNTIEEAVRARRQYIVVYRLLTVAGTEKWVWDEGEAEMTDDESIVGLEGFLVDIG